MKLNNKLIEYVKTSASKSQASQKQFMFNKISIVIKDEFVQFIDLKAVLKELNNSIPAHLFSNVEAIYVGQFPELIQRSVNAAYMDGAIYVSNIQQNENDLIDDLVHEIAHSVEELVKFKIYEDDKVMKEFLVKRKKLKELLRMNGYPTENQDFSECEFSQEFDRYLYEDIGYPILNTLTVGLFCSSYGATSLREYFGNGFEYFFLKQKNIVKTISPLLYAKLAVIEKSSFFEDLEDLRDFT